MHVCRHVYFTDLRKALFSRREARIYSNVQSLIESCQRPHNADKSSHLWFISQIFWLFVITDLFLNLHHFRHLTDEQVVGDFVVLNNGEVHGVCCAFVSYIYYLGCPRHRADGDGEDRRKNNSHSLPHHVCLTTQSNSQDNNSDGSSPKRPTYITPSCALERLLSQPIGNRCSAFYVMYFFFTPLICGSLVLVSRDCSCPLLLR